MGFDMVEHQHFIMNLKRDRDVGKILDKLTNSFNRLASAIDKDLTRTEKIIISMLPDLLKNNEDTHYLDGAGNKYDSAVHEAYELAAALERKKSTENSKE